MNLRQILWALSMLGLIILIVYNIRNNSNFFITSIHFIINIIIAIVFAYYLVQNKNDERKRKEIAEKVLRDIQLLSLTKLVDSPVDKLEFMKKILMHKRSLNNKIKALEGIGDALGINEHIKYIKDKFEEYEALIDEMNKENYQGSSDKIMFLIDEKCELAIVELYKRKANKRNYRK